MNRNTIIEKLYLDKRFSDAAKKITKDTDYCEDLKSEVIIVLLENTNLDLIIELDKKNQLIFYSVRIMLNMFRSKTSGFFKKHRHHSDSINLILIDCDPLIIEEKFGEAIFGLDENEYFKNIELKELEEKETKINNRLNDTYWYDRQVFLEYLEVGSYRKLEAKTRIPMKSLQLTCLKVKEILRNDL